ncbi:hypothetical protein DL767_001074 [Monosporascus sp. MG133]|nr:hypothetical protein DL767_001074 [Monosporascus sp. MG133]
MPFFSSRKPEEHVVEEPAPPPEKKHHGLFGSRHRTPSPPTTTSNRTTSVSSRTSGGSEPSRHRSMLSRFGGGHGRNGADMDPSIQAARERVMNAERAEAEADQALAAARLHVREARDEVRRLELEAEEEARRAKIKQYHAREVSKRGKQLGRHDI